MRKEFLSLLLLATFSTMFLGCADPVVDTVPPNLDYLSVNIGTLKYVPAGSFQRDATASNSSTVNAFRMSEYEITRLQFYLLMGGDPSDTTKTSGTGDPVQKTNWYHAIAFCNKLSIAEGLDPVYAVTSVNFTTLNFASIPITSNVTWNCGSQPIV